MERLVYVISSFWLQAPILQERSLRRVSIWRSLPLREHVLKERSNRFYGECFRRNRERHAVVNACYAAFRIVLRYRVIFRRTEKFFSFVWAFVHLITPFHNYINARECCQYGNIGVRSCVCLGLCFNRACVPRMIEAGKHWLPGAWQSRRFHREGCRKQGRNGILIGFCYKIHRRTALCEK